MIKVNLATRKRSASVGATQLSGLPSFDLNNFLDLLYELKKIPFRKLVVPLVIGTIVAYGLGVYEDNEVLKLDSELQSVIGQKPKLQAQVNKLKEYENLKKSMESDESLMRGKLETIQQLIKGRSDMPRLLVDLSRTIPKSIWLSEFSLKSDEGRLNIDLKGKSTSYRQISPFLKTLNENPFFRDLTLTTSRSDRDELGREIFVFDLVQGGNP